MLLTTQNNTSTSTKSNDSLKQSDKRDKTIPEITITVKARRVEETIKTIPANINSVDSEKLQEEQAKTAADVFETVTGVDKIGATEWGLNTGVNMRGSIGQYGAQRVLVTLDGRPINEEYQGNLDFRLFPTSYIEKIEILKGPYSVLYGTHAIGGVINILSKRGGKEPIFNITNSFWSHNSRQHSFQYGSKYKITDYFISADCIETDGYLRNSDGSKRDWQLGNIFGKVGFKFTETSDLVFSGMYTEGNGNREDYDEYISRNYQDIFYSYKFGRDYTNNLLLRIYRNGLKQDLDWHFGYLGRYDQETIGGQIQFDSAIGEQHRLVSGVDAFFPSVYVKEFNGIVDKDRSTIALFAEDHINLLDKYYLSLGARYDWDSIFSGEFSYRASFLIALNKEVSLWTAIGKAYRAPTFSDLYLPETHYFGMIFVGNKDLEPETSLNYELGMRYLSEKIHVQATIFTSKEKDSWDFMLDSDGKYRPHNVTNIDAYGLELSSEYKISNIFSTEIGYTFTNAEYGKYKPKPEIEGNYLEDIVRNQGWFKIKYKDERNRIVIGQMRVVGPRYTDPENTSAGRLGGFVVIDLKSQIPLFKWQETTRGKLIIGVDNILDKHYREVKEYPQPGRVFSVGLSIDF